MVLFVCLSIEQDRMASNYLKEACAIELHLHDNRTCDLKASLPKINITLLPCGLMPIQARNYQGIYLGFKESLKS